LKYCLLILLCPLFGHSQCRYFDRIFNNINKTANVIYGNAPAITSFYISESFTTAQDLKLDIFQPQGDIEPKRAMIIFAHSGGFINGTKDNQDMQALSDSFAHYGYVTASIEYRKNFNLFSSNSSERAVWRGIQDASSAIRFFKQNAVLYNIDTTRIFVWGSSAGAFMALGLAYVDDSERPASTFSSPNLGCKDCSGNNFAFSSKVLGIISCWGATKDTSWIQNNNNIPVQLFHGTSDATVPFTEGYPFGLPTITYVRGSQQLNEQLNRTSVYHEFYSAAGQGHEYWGTSNGTFVATGPTAYWADIINKAKVFMTGRMGAVPVCGPLPLTLLDFTGKPDNDIVNLYWNTAAEYNVKKIVVERSSDGVSFNRLTEVIPKGSSSTGASYTSTDYYPFPGISFYRLKIIDADGSIGYSKTISIQMAKKDFSVTQLYPNPVKDLLYVQVQSGKFQAVQLFVFDMTGKQLLTKTINLKEGVNDTNIPFANFGSGLYIIKYVNAAGNSLGSFKIVKD
jgi:poly(3-hydroxybutyrate) depolymerase